MIQKVDVLLIVLIMVCVFFGGTFSFVLGDAPLREAGRPSSHPEFHQVIYREGV